MLAVRCVYQLGINSYLVSGFANTAFKQIADPEVLPDLLRVYRLSL